jgi:choline dehydrogenase-like flavoprotein
MGEDEEAVVDTNLKVWGLDNLWLANTGVLPSAGTANPTFTLLCLGTRLANSLPALH